MIHSCPLRRFDLSWLSVESGCIQLVGGDVLVRRRVAALLSHSQVCCCTWVIYVMCEFVGDVLVQAAPSCCLRFACTCCFICLIFLYKAFWNYRPACTILTNKNTWAQHLYQRGPFLCLAWFVNHTAAIHNSIGNEENKTKERRRIASLSWSD